MANPSALAEGECIEGRCAVGKFSAPPATDVDLSEVNAGHLRDMRALRSRSRRSGIGRDAGTDSLDFYAESTHVSVAL
jgi:hypothetical protein